MTDWRIELECERIKLLRLHTRSVRRGLYGEAAERWRALLRVTEMIAKLESGSA